MGKASASMEEVGSSYLFDTCMINLLLIHFPIAPPPRIVFASSKRENLLVLPSTEHVSSSQRRGPSPIPLSLSEHEGTKQGDKEGKGVMHGALRYPIPASVPSCPLPAIMVSPKHIKCTKAGVVKSRLVRGRMTKGGKQGQLALKNKVNDSRLGSR